MSAEAEVKEEMQAEHYEDFMDCARFGEAEGVGIYIEHGADVNWSDSFGTTALHRDWAVQQQQKEIVKVLLELCADADVVLENAAEQSALDLAEELGFAALAALLVGHASVDKEADKVAEGGGAAAPTEPAAGAGEGE